MSGRTLFQRLSEDPRVIHDAWHEVNRNARSLSHGIDEVRLNDYSAHAQTRLAKLRLKIKNGTFQFKELRAAVIPKEGGEYRALQVATIDDRVVQKAIEMLIRKHLNNKYNLFNNPVSYAFIRTEDIDNYDERNPQTYKGVRGAIEKLKNYSQQGFTWCLKADIVNFFPSINTEKLLKTLVFPALPDQTINELITSAFKQEVQISEATRKVLSPEQLEAYSDHNGLPQGSILSPLFSNVYLSSFDKNLSDRGFIVIRYVDDFLVMTKSKEDAKKAYSIAKDELKELGLKLYSIGHKKSSIQETSEVTFLGVRLYQGNFFPSEKVFTKMMTKLAEYPKYKTLTKNFQSVQMLVSSWAATYYFCSNDTAEYIRVNKALKDAVMRTLYKSRLKPLNNLGSRELRRLGIYQFDNAIVTYKDRK